MKPPRLVTAPASAIVSLPDMKAHLRVDHTDEDALISSYISAATGYLDGWKGVLGRPVLSQTWREEFDGFGDLRLALPDVVSVTVTATDDAGGAVTVTRSDLKQDICGHYVTTEGGAAASTVAVQYVAAMPAEQAASVELIVKLLVGHWYANREAVTAESLIEAPMAVRMLVDSMRWSLM